MSDIEKLLRAGSQGRGSVESLYRGLAEYPDWRVLQDADGGFAPMVDAQGRSWVTLVHDDEALQQLQRGGFRPERVGRVPGHVAFGTMLDGVYGLQIDPDTPWSIHFTVADHGQTLQRWAAAIRVEQVLANPGLAEDPFAVYRDYRGYQVVVVRDSDGNETVAMAPDDRGRVLVAVFTANDTAQAFVRKERHRLKGSVRVLHFSGTKLFRTLQRREMDGIVFNCSGPVPARAFQPAFADQVLG